jgi:hypothetical protein
VITAAVFVGNHLCERGANAAVQKYSSRLYCVGDRAYRNSCVVQGTRLLPCVFNYAIALYEKKEKSFKKLKKMLDFCARMCYTILL